MTDPLDTNLRDLMDDRPLLDRVLKALALDQGVSYFSAYEQLTEAAECRATLREALSWTRSDPENIGESVTLLERRDAAVARALDQASGGVALRERTDPLGRVLLDQSGADAPAAQTTAPLTEDIGLVLGDPVTFERRLARARAAQPGAWSGDDGRQRFAAHDRQMAEAGIDSVRSLERAHELAAARVHAQQVAAALDRAIADAGDERMRLRALEAKLDEVEGPAARSGIEFARAQLRREASASTEPVLRMLDALEVLEEPATTSTPPLTGVDAARRELDHRVRERMRRSGIPSRGYVRALEQEVAGVPMPAEPVVESEVPVGIHPGSHAVHEKVQAKLKALDKPQSEYSSVLERMIADGDI